MNKHSRRCRPLVLLLWLLVTSTAAAQGVEPGSEAEKRCRECHAVPDLSRTDPITGREVNLTVDLEGYGRSVHGQVQCYDCHERGYEQLPHTGPRAYPRFLCVDCHTQNRELAKLELTARRDDLLSSVHGRKAEFRFDCHTCHDPHTFSLIRDAPQALQRIDTSNAICLSCHGPDEVRDPGFADLPDITRKHGRFPNPRAHFRKLKCVTCHTPTESSTRHDVVGPDAAVRECTQCHRRDSPLLQANYARPDPLHDGLEVSADGDGVQDNVYVIGSSRLPDLERLSVVGFLLLLSVILLHALARMVRARKDGKW